MGLFKRTPRTPAQNKAAKARGEKAMNARTRRARQIADKQERKKRR